VRFRSAGFSNESVERTGAVEGVRTLRAFAV